MIYVDRFLRLALPCLALLFLSCSESNTPTGILGPAKAFKLNEMPLTANVDTNIVHGEQQIILTARCMPLIDGKGRVGLHGTGFLAASEWILDAPVRDTIIAQSGDVIWLPADFHANVPFEQRWTVRMIHNTDYEFGAHAIIDSLVIPDTTAPVWTSSAEGRRFTGPWTYQFGIQGKSLYLRRVD